MVDCKQSFIDTTKECCNLLEAMSSLKTTIETATKGNRQQNSFLIMEGYFFIKKS